MNGFVRGMEMSVFSALVGAANATGRRRQPAPQVRVIRQTSRQSLDQLACALRGEMARADKLEAENRNLRRRLANAHQATAAVLNSTRRR